MLHFAFQIILFRYVFFLFYILEMLMEEFREAHRKMFGQHAVLPVDDNTKNGNSLPTLSVSKIKNLS